MYVKSVHIDGFKSYGKRVEINGFDTKFNAITGLNGSGKSNILDAICFVLGISNLSHVRVSSLQELIFKNGQAGINSATVTIIFDNKDKDASPTGYENFNEIVISRQVIMGGKNKYWINSCVVTNKKVQDLFCSVQLNINNPHFLIMQGKITKVLNMKAKEILGMLEEAAGTRMFEVKRISTERILEKKTVKLQELNTIINEELSPKLDKLRQERQSYMDYTNIERELTNMKNLYEAFLFYASQRFTQHCLEKLEGAETECQTLESNIEENIKLIDGITDHLMKMSREADQSLAGKMEELEVEVKAKEKAHSKAIVIIKNAKESITGEEKKLKDAEKNIKSDGVLLEKKQEELAKVEDLFETLRQNDANDAEAHNLAQKKYEAVCAGMEINESGEAQSLQEQLIALKDKASASNAQIKTASKQKSLHETDMRKKEKLIGAAGKDYNTAKANFDHTKQRVLNLEDSMQKLHYCEEEVGALKARHQQLAGEVRQHRQTVENFEARRPNTKFTYRDPTPQFDRRTVNGVVCRLIKVKEAKYATALETAAGGRLYNVIVQNEGVSKLILQRCQLQQRTTFLPLNKMQGARIPPKVVQLAQELVGREHCIPAMQLIDYEAHLQPAIEFIFGQVFVCTDLDVARRVTFHPQIKKRCVTLEGDVTDPGGTLSGGARSKSPPILVQLMEAIASEERLQAAEGQLQRMETELRLQLQKQETWTNMSAQLDLTRIELANMEAQLKLTTHHQSVQEVDELKRNIAELTEIIAAATQVERDCTGKIAAMEANLKDADGHRERVLKAAEKDMKAAKLQSDKSRNEWAKRKAEFEMLKLEIGELQTGVQTSTGQLADVQAEIRRLRGELAEMQEAFRAQSEELQTAQDAHKALKQAGALKNKEIAKKNADKERLQAQIAEFRLEIQKQEHGVAKLRDEHKKATTRESEHQKRAAKIDKRITGDAAKLSDKEGQALHAKIAANEEKRVRLGRNINVNAQKMFDLEEKQYAILMKRVRVVKSDKRKLEQLIQSMYEKKKEALTLAYNRVKKDFGSIFATLLPGANATLAAAPNMTIMDGLEIKVSLGGIWKDNLSELSGGQRSLAALSLILSMLLFKPAPLYILDEVDAALDLSHTQNIGTMLKDHFKQSQFIVVSLKDGMFANANVLFRTKFIDGASSVSRTVNKN